MKAVKKKFFLLFLLFLPNFFIIFLFPRKKYQNGARNFNRTLRFQGQLSKLRLRACIAFKLYKIPRFKRLLVFYSPNLRRLKRFAYTHQAPLQARK